MDFIFRAIITLKEKLGRTLILLSIMFVISAVVLSSFGIQSATDAAAVLARQKLGANVTLSQNVEKLMQEQRENMAANSTEGEKQGGGAGRFNITRVQVPLEYIDELSSNESVVAYLATNSIQANLDELLAVGASEEETIEETSSKQGFGGGMNMKGSMGDITFTGINDFKTTSAYVNGEAELLEGRELTEDDLGTNNVMIEENFAIANNLEIGSEFNITNISGENLIGVTVIGIYKTYTSIDDNGLRNTAMLPYNNIYSSYTLVNLLNGKAENSGVDSITFYLDDPANVDSFLEYGDSTSIDFDTFILDAGNREYEAMIEPIENVASFSKITILIVAVFGGAILALIIMLSIKDRIHEVGILMSLGEKKFKIIGQFTVEVLTVLLLAIVISVAAGNTISNKMSDILLANELKTEQTEVSNLVTSDRPTKGNKPMIGMNSSSTTVDKIEESNVNISLLDIGKMSGISILIAIIATMLPSLMIMRYNPKQILSKHN